MKVPPAAARIAPAPKTNSQLLEPLSSAPLPVFGGDGIRGVEVAVAGMEVAVEVGGTIVAVAVGGTVVAVAVAVGVDVAGVVAVAVAVAVGVGSGMLCCERSSTR